MTVVTLYTKAGCHLCEEARAVIDRVARRREFELVVRDILDNPGDYDRYRHDVPVIALNGREIARHRLSDTQLEAALDA